LSAFGLALMPALFSYGGWQNLNFVAGEVKAPGRTLPAAIVSGVSLVIAVYVLANLVYVRALPLAAIQGSTKLASDAVQAMIGSRGAMFVALAVIVSTFGITNVFIMTGPRVYYTMARAGAFLPFAGRLDPRFGTPALSIGLQSAWATVPLFSNTYGRLLQIRDLRRLDLLRLDRPGPDRPAAQAARHAAALPDVGLSGRARPVRPDLGRRLCQRFHLRSRPIPGRDGHHPGRASAILGGPADQSSAAERSR
jgi:hypothetical protein